MSSRVSGGGDASSNQSSQRRLRPSTRYADLQDKPKKKRPQASARIISIPNTIKLSMLNSGLLSFERIKLEARDANNSLSNTIPDKPIDLKIFVKLCEQRRKFPILYKLEFQTAVKVETNNSCRHANRRNNSEKNQNKKCIPYDFNRVVLEKLPAVPDSDYINASYVDSLLKPNAYIVTQGPTEETVTDFWRMVWQEKVCAIIMLTKTFDFTKVMCVQYWPASKEKDEAYGDIWIGIAREEQLANFQIRTFHIYKKGLNNEIAEERNLIQFHYSEWHSHSVPFPNAVLEFRRRVRSVVGNIITSHSLIGPMLVHCNDGGGRSGVYLAIDANMELAEEEECFHVFGYLKKLRQSRRGMIENVDQYKFVYDTLEEHIICGKSWFSVTQLSEKLKQKSQKDQSKMNEYQREFAQISKQTPRASIGECAGGHRADNREKNRDVLCVPPDNFRPYLTSFQGNSFTDYINAVFVDGYTKPREYIVTEWPLQKTLGEFWSLVYDQECSAVVVICSPPATSQEYPPFWPEKRKSSQKFGPVFTVTCKNSKHYTNIKTWEFSINKKIVSLTELMAGVKAPVRSVQLFQLTCWPAVNSVPTSTNSLVELMNMVEQWREKVEYGPVCVVSPDGRSRAGVYCAANACIEQVIQHGEVDIFQAVKTVRRHRSELVNNITEYKYCYDLVLHYVLHYLKKDLKEKKFIEFGRGKIIPLTPENSKADLPAEISNIGRIVVTKCIEKIEKIDTNASTLFGPNDTYNLAGSSHDPNIFSSSSAALFCQSSHQLRNNNKKKKRLYSLGGNEPIRIHKAGRRLNRLQTVGTFDLTNEMIELDEKCSLETSNNNSTSTELFNSSSASSPKDLHIRKPIRGMRPSQNLCSKATGGSLQCDASRKEDETPIHVEVATTKTDNTSKESIGQKSDIDEVNSTDDVFSRTEPYTSITNSSSGDFQSRKSTFRKSARIIRTDSELIREEIIQTSIEDEDEGADEASDQFNVLNNLQREYKSDGNTLDEIGLTSSGSKWMNYSLDNCLLSGSSEHDVGQLEDSRGGRPSAGSRELCSGPGTACSKTSSKFENTFKKINRAWKCNRFNSSNVCRKKEMEVSIKGDMTDVVVSPTSVIGSPKASVTSTNSIFNKIMRTPTVTSSPSSSVASSNSHQRPKKLFANQSVSNTELYKVQKPKKCIGELLLSKSNSDIDKSNGSGGIMVGSSPFRRNAVKSQKILQPTKAIKLDKLKTNSAGCLYNDGNRSCSDSGTAGSTSVNQRRDARSPVPISEEFYNKTGSVRLSAIELFEKFCSEDFCGLYKEDDDGRIGSSAFRRHMFRKNSKLLKQRSEPRFSIKMMQHSLQPQQYQFDDVKGLYKEDEEYFDNEEGEGFEDEEGEGEGEGDFEDEYDEEEYDECVDENTAEATACNASAEENHLAGTANNYAEDMNEDDGLFMFPGENQDEVDEIILMPETSCVGFQAKNGHLHKCEVIYDLNHLVSDDNINSNTLLLSVIKDYVQSDTSKVEIIDHTDLDDHDILTIYRICSVENLVTPKVSMPSSKSDTQFMQKPRTNNINSVWMNSCERREKSKPNLVHCSLNDFMEPLGQDGTDDKPCNSIIVMEEEETFSEDGDQEDDTVRFLCPDSFGSRLSLSLFDDLSLNFSLTLTDPHKLGDNQLAPDCDIEDYNLTSEGSVSESLLDVSKGGIGAIICDEASMKADITSCAVASENLCDAATLDIHCRSQLIESFFETESIQYTDGDEEGDNENDNEEGGNGKASHYTTELQREFDVLFDRAADHEINDQASTIHEVTVPRPPPSASSTTTASKTSLLSSIRIKISSRHSMQNLEPYDPLSKQLQDNNHRPLMGSINKSSSVDEKRKQRETQRESEADTDNGDMYIGCLCQRFRRKKSLSVGSNLEKKSYCFPL